jgi:hypothetical protein
LVAAVHVVEGLDHAFVQHLVQTLIELLELGRVGVADPGEDFGREARDFAVLHGLGRR